MKVNFNIFISLISLTVTLQLSAQDNVITFREILNEGFESNYNIKLEKLNLSKANYTLLRANGFLNPFIDSKIVYGEGVDPALNNDGTAYIQSKIVLPTKYGIDFYTGARLQRTTEIGSPNFTINSSGIFTGVKIPLLRGLGKYNPENSFIEVSKINKIASNKQFSNRILTYFSELLINYLTLKEAIDEFSIEKKNVEESNVYKNDIYTLAEKDLIPLVEKNRVNSFYNEKLQQLTNANINVLKAYYNTKIILGLNEDKIDSTPQITDQIPNPNKDKLIKYINRTKPNLTSLIKNTPQYKIISLEVDKSKILLKTAKNQKKNPLDLDFSVSRFGNYNNGQYNLNNTFRSNYPGYSFQVSLTHSLSIKNEKQKGAYLEQLTEYDLSKTFLQKYIYENTTILKLNLNLLKQKITLYDQAELISDLMEKNYQNELDKLKLGNSTQTDVIIAFDNYFNALKSLNLLKYDIWKTYVNIKFKLGELPNNAQELAEFSFLDFF